MKFLTRILLLVSCIPGIGRLAAADMDMKGDMKSDILAAYVKVSTALAADDLAGAKTAAAAVASHADMSGMYKAIGPKATAVAKAGKIDAARDAFKSLSAAVEPLAADEKGCVVMYCPMAKADWVQMTGKTANPYFGKAMLTCGEPKAAK